MNYIELIVNDQIFITPLPSYRIPYIRCALWHQQRRPRGPSNSFCEIAIPKSFLSKQLTEIMFNLSTSRLRIINESLCACKADDINARS